METVTGIALLCVLLVVAFRWGRLATQVEELRFELSDLRSEVDLLSDVTESHEEEEHLTSWG